jgi:hypothetical protein
MVRPPGPAWADASIPPAAQAGGGAASAGGQSSSSAPRPQGAVKGQQDAAVGAMSHLDGQLGLLAAGESGCD